MDEWIKIVGLTLMAGLAMPLGAILARFERIGPNWLEEEFRHLVIAFGGGALLSAVALVLVPEGSEDLPNEYAKPSGGLQCLPGDDIQPR